MLQHDKAGIGAVDAVFADEYVLLVARYSIASAVGVKNGQFVEAVGE